MLRRLVLLVGAAVLIDTAFYAVIAPLLPGLSHELHLSKAGAGVLAASYPAGMFVASIPTGILAVRIGPRLTICAGLALLALATLGFGLLDSAPGLDVARFVEGAAGACSWAGGIAWLVQVAPPDRRGVTMGQAVGAAVFGSMGGPAIGALAAVTGRAGLFAGLAAVALGLAVLTAIVPAAEPATSEVGVVTGPEAGRATADTRAGVAPDAASRRRPASPRPGDVRAMLTLLRDGESWSALWLMALPAVASGLLTVLGSLQLHHLGVSEAQIGITFLAAAAIELAVAPLVGRVSDRRGRLVPMRAGLVCAAVSLALFTLPSSGVVLALLIVVIAGSLGAFWAPSMALLSDVAARRGVEQGLAAALMNLAWAVGQIVGAAGSGGAAKLGGDLVPSLAAAGVCAATFLALALRRNGSLSAARAG